jgi:hypothetical protein
METFQLVLQSTSNGAAAIHGLKYVLKAAWRQHRLRCLDARQIHPTTTLLRDTLAAGESCNLSTAATGNHSNE